jgi:hypothetical protein
MVLDEAGQLFEKHLFLLRLTQREDTHSDASRAR